jgi:hypothetical protein
MNADAPTVYSSLLDIFLEPRKALEGARGRIAWLWAPLLLVIVVACLFQVWYAYRVDVSWFADQTLAPGADKMTADQLRDAHARFSANGIAIYGTIFGCAGVAGWYLLQTLYFFFAAKLGGYKEQGFGNWFNFIAWTSLPALLGYLASGLYMLTTSSNQISPVDIDITSLNTLVFHVAYAHKGQFIASSLRLTTLWSWALMIIGFSAWTGKNKTSAALVVLAPYALLYAVFVIYALI